MATHCPRAERPAVSRTRICNGIICFVMRNGEPSLFLLTMFGSPENGTVTKQGVLHRPCRVTLWRIYTDGFLRKYCRNYPEKNILLYSTPHIEHRSALLSCWKNISGYHSKTLKPRRTEYGKLYFWQVGTVEEIDQFVSNLINVIFGGSWAGWI